mmetsp:Transcript_25322/g.70818  ORF Transcript_25322/g.70818 Transcript_25322/m.70818 type:complete len:444 (-) Transcript_25322:395-1726(-)
MDLQVAASRSAAVMPLSGASRLPLAAAGRQGVALVPVKRGAVRQASWISSPPSEASIVSRSQGTIVGRLHRVSALAIAEPLVVDAPRTPSRELPEDLVGGRYRVGPVLGKGSFGTVYLANDTFLYDRHVAVKKLCRRSTKRLSEEEQSFKIREEVRLMREVQSCRFVSQYHGFEVQGDYMFLMMEWIDGPSLGEVLQHRGKFTEIEAAAAIHDILQTLSHCHGAGVCHSDVKPANFLYASGQEVSSCIRGRPWAHVHDMQLDLDSSSKLLRLEGLDIGDRVLKAIDFGCSQQVSLACPRLTKPKGTPVYSAPELYMRSYGCEADVWSCGMILHQLLTGKLPFWDEPLDDLTRQQVFDGVMYGKADFSGPDWDGISEEAVDLCRKMLDRRENVRISANAAAEHPWIQKHMRSRAGSQWDSSTVPHWAIRQSKDCPESVEDFIVL